VTGCCMTDGHAGLQVHSREQPSVCLPAWTCHPHPHQQPLAWCDVVRSEHPCDVRALVRMVVLAHGEVRHTQGMPPPFERVPGQHPLLLLPLILVLWHRAAMHAAWSPLALLLVAAQHPAGIASTVAHPLMRWGCNLEHVALHSAHYWMARRPSEAACLVGQ
jgi:hypothetical protein